MSMCKKCGKKSTKVLLLWYTIGLNYGDYLIYKTVVQYLEQWECEYDSLDVGLPYGTIAEYVSRYDFLWFIGGGIIERGIPDVIRNFPQFHKKTGKIKYGISGLSIGDFDYSFKKTELAYWVSNSEFFYSRDDYTANTLNQFANKEIVNSGVDVVFSNKALYNISTNDGGKVGINIRELPYTDLTGEFKWREWNRVFREMSQWEIIGIADQLDGLVKFDISRKEVYSPDSVTTTIRAASFVVAMRFHVILVSSILGKIVIPINYCPKVNRLAEQLGIQKLMLGIHDYENLKKSVNEAIENKGEYEKIVSKNVIRMRSQADEMFENINIILKGV